MCSLGEVGLCRRQKVLLGLPAMLEPAGVVPRRASPGPRLLTRGARGSRVHRRTGAYGREATGNEWAAFHRRIRGTLAVLRGDHFLAVTPAPWKHRIDRHLT